MKEVNGFQILENKNKSNSAYPNDKDYLVFHPICDGHYMLYDSDDEQDCVDWCTKEKFDEWHDWLAM